MTHCYWREDGPDFGNVNIMGVVHGTEKETVLTHKEAIDLLSTLRMGIDLRIVKELARQAVNELFILTQPAHLQKLHGSTLSGDERSIARAQYLRGRLGLSNN